MVLGTSKKQTTQARRLIEKFKVKERLKIASSKPLANVRNGEFKGSLWAPSLSDVGLWRRRFANAAVAG